MNRQGRWSMLSYPDLRYYTGICQIVGAEIKVPLSLSLIMHRIINTHGVKALDGDVWSVSHSCRSIPIMSPRKLLDGWTGGPHNRYGRFKEQNNLCPHRESGCRPARDLVPNNRLMWGGTHVCKEEMRENTDTPMQDSRPLGWSEVAFIGTERRHENAHSRRGAPGLRCEPGIPADQSQC